MSDPVELTVNAISATPTSIVAGTDILTDGVVFPNTGKEFVVLMDTSTDSESTITIKTGATVDGLGVGDLEVVVSANAQVILGPFSTSVYNDGDGNIEVQTADVSGDVQIIILK